MKIGINRMDRPIYTENLDSVNRVVSTKVNVSIEVPRISMEKKNAIKLSELISCQAKRPVHRIVVHRVLMN